MNTRYHCHNPGRRDAVAKQTALNGIDYLEVATADQKTLKVFFVLPLPSPLPLIKKNVVITGGVRIRNLRVLAVAAADNVLTVTVDGRGDFSTYTLQLIASEHDTRTPAGFDPQLASVEFSFKATCPSEFDCQPRPAGATTSPASPDLNYLAKDYAGFRRLMLDRLSVIMPDWRERNPADQQVALVELLAYAGDRLSYFQDATATEAYLGTARQRVSVRRHARLLDYAMHDGCNARAWVCLNVSEDAERVSELEAPPLPRGAKLLTDLGPPPAGLTADSPWLRQAQPVFEPMLPVHGLYVAHNEIRFYTWSDLQCCLPTCATRATLRDDHPAGRLRLCVGDVLILEEVAGAISGLPADANRLHRHTVRLTKVSPEAVQTIAGEVVSRVPGALKSDPLTSVPIVEIEWASADALPFPLAVSALVETSTGESVTKELSVARGNVALVDHGLTIAGEPLVPDTVPALGAYRPALAHGPLTFQGPLDVTKPAAEAMCLDVRTARPEVRLNGEGRVWSPQLDLMASDRFSNEFVVELGNQEIRNGSAGAGAASLRFGDGVLGQKPTAGARFRATYRVGQGPDGNVGAETITRVLFAHPAITGVRNPLPAIGGTAPESMEEARQFAPQAFRRQERAVTEADYAAVAGRHPGVQKAAASFRWTGSWLTAFVAIDRKGGLEVDGAFKREMAAWLDRFRLAGYDVEINGAVYVPLDLALRVCVKPGYFRADVKAALLDALGNRDLADGRRGFLHPDNFTFGQAVFTSAIYATAMAVAGVESVTVTRFQRWGQTADHELENAVLRPGSFEIARLDNDRNFPENGRLELSMGGGM